MTKLDIGCGKNKKEGFTGMDQYDMPGVDVIHDVRKTPWPFEDESVEEVHCSHFLEHLTAEERVAFFNELYRVMKPDAKATFITPHWCSNRAYGDMTHKWPAVSEMFYHYLYKDWRTVNAPHLDSEYNKKGFKCNFTFTAGHSFGPELSARNQEYVLFALQNYKEAAQDLIATIIKVK